jgi:hypothetical protein
MDIRPAHIDNSSRRGATYFIKRLEWYVSALTIDQILRTDLSCIGFTLEREKKGKRKDDGMDQRIFGSVGSLRTPGSQVAFGSQTVFGSESTLEPRRTSNYSKAPEYHEFESRPFMERREQQRSDWTPWDRA